MVKIAMVTWSGTRELYSSEEPQTCDVCGATKYPGQWICYGTDWSSSESSTWCSYKCFEKAKLESIQSFDLPHEVPAHWLRLILPIIAKGYKFIGNSWLATAASISRPSTFARGSNLEEPIVWNKSRPCRGYWKGISIWEYWTEDETNYWFSLSIGGGHCAESLWFEGKIEPVAPWVFEF